MEYNVESKRNRIRVRRGASRARSGPCLRPDYTDAEPLRRLDRIGVTYANDAALASLSHGAPRAAFPGNGSAPLGRIGAPLAFVSHGVMATAGQDDGVDAVFWPNRCSFADV